MLCCCIQASVELFPTSKALEGAVGSWFHSVVFDPSDAHSRTRDMISISFHLLCVSIIAVVVVADGIASVDHLDDDRDSFPTAYAWGISQECVNDSRQQLESFRQGISWAVKSKSIQISKSNVNDSN